MKNHKIDNVRAFAIVTGIIGHSIILYSSQWGLYEAERSSMLLDYIKRFINLYQMPLFFSLSGYLFTMTWKNRTFVSFTVNKLKRLIFPFISVGMFWMIPVKMLIHYPFSLWQQADLSRIGLFSKPYLRSSILDVLRLSIAIYII